MEKKAKIIRNVISLAVVWGLCMCCPIWAAGNKKLSDNLRIAVTAETANVYSHAIESSEVVKHVVFGQQLQVKQCSKNWYSVEGGYIHKTDAVLYDVNKKHIALTFDDGPNEINTKTVLDALEQYDAKATFMVIGQNINSVTGELIKREMELECEIGNHSYSHANFKNIAPEKAQEELQKTDEAVEDYTGEKPTLIRTPYGLCENNVWCCMDRPNVSWSVDTEDWKYKDSDRLIQYVTENASDGAIVLMHDIYKTTAQAVEPILEELIKQNYEMMTVTELSAIKGVELKAGETYRLFEKKEESVSVIK